MNNPRQSLHRRLFLLPLCVFLMLLLGIAYLVHTIQLNQKEIHRSMELVEEYSHFLVNIAELTRWQQALSTSADQSSLYHAQRRTSETEDQINVLLDRWSVLMDPEIDQLIADSKILLELNQALLSVDIPDEKASLLVTYRSYENIIVYQTRSLIEDTMFQTNQLSIQRLLRIIFAFIVGLVLLLLLSIALILSIIKRRKTELELKRTRNYLYNVLNSMPSILIGIGFEGNITEINRQAEILCGIPAQAAKGKPLQSLFPSIQTYLREIQNSMKNKEILHRSHIRLESDKDRLVDLTAFPLVMNGIQGSVIRVDDVTQKVKMEEQLQQSQKMTAVGQLAGGIAHDFNNMLAGILGAVDILEEYLEEGGDEYLGIIVDSAEKAADLVRQLLSFAHKSKITLVPVDVHETIESASKLLVHSINKTIRIEKAFQAEHFIVAGDIAQLESVLLNLGINSAHAIEGAGSINFHTREVILDQDYCESSPFELIPGTYIQIEVRDSGKGIPPEYLSRIFDPFFTTKERGEGTGLGLSTVYGVITQMRGAVTVYSELGRGTVFHILLPLHVAWKKPVELREEEPQTSWGRVLVVDDEPAVRKTAGAILSRAGYEVVFAFNGKEALERVEKERESFDIIILDMVMPVMGGKDCFYALRKIDPGIPILMASGFSQHQDIVELRTQGLNGFIQKPYRRNELLIKISRILDDSSG